MSLRWMNAFVDRPADTFDAATSFWQQVTASGISAPRGEHGEFATLVPAVGDSYLRVQRTEHGGGCHLDLRFDDMADEAARAVTLGASELRRLDDVILLASPGGFVFCIVGPGDERVVPPPVSWPEGHRSLLDQVCLDIPPSGYEREVEFWASLFGWPRRESTHREFERLVRPDGLPLRILVQRLDDEEPGQQVRAHFDLACDDVEAEVRRHEALGAEMVRRRAHWVVLLDPAGVEYCITSRPPE